MELLVQLSGTHLIFLVAQCYRGFSILKLPCAFAQPLKLTSLELTLISPFLWACLLTLAGRSSLLTSFVPRRIFLSSCWHAAILRTRMCLYFVKLFSCKCSTILVSQITFLVKIYNWMLSYFPLLSVYLKVITNKQGMLKQKARNCTASGNSTSYNTTLDISVLIKYPHRNEIN